MLLRGQNWESRKNVRLMTEVFIRRLTRNPACNHATKTMPKIGIFIFHLMINSYVEFGGTPPPPN